MHVHCRYKLLGDHRLHNLVFGYKTSISVFFSETVSLCTPGWPQIHSVAQASTELSSSAFLFQAITGSATMPGSYIFTEAVIQRWIQKLMELHVSMLWNRVSSNVSYMKTMVVVTAVWEWNIERREILGLQGWVCQSSASMPSAFTPSLCAQLCMADWLFNLAVVLSIEGTGKTQESGGKSSSRLHTAAAWEQRQWWVSRQQG